MRMPSFTSCICIPLHVTSMTIALEKADSNQCKFIWAIYAYKIYIRYKSAVWDRGQHAAYSDIEYDVTMIADWRTVDKLLSWKSIICVMQSCAGRMMANVAVAVDSSDWRVRTDGLTQSSADVVVLGLRLVGLGPCRTLQNTLCTTYLADEYYTTFRI